MLHGLSSRVHAILPDGFTLSSERWTLRSVASSGQDVRSLDLVMQELDVAGILREGEVGRRDCGRQELDPRRTRNWGRRRRSKRSAPCTHGTNRRRQRRLGWCRTIKPWLTMLLGVGEPLGEGSQGLEVAGRLLDTNLATANTLPTRSVSRNATERAASHLRPSAGIALQRTVSNERKQRKITHPCPRLLIVVEPVKVAVATARGQTTTLPTQRLERRHGNLLNS